MDELTIFLELFKTFFLIGLFTIGGGYAMLSLIETQTVAVHGWLSEGEFIDIVGISQMTPGPIGINSATYVGYSVLQGQGAEQWLCVLGSFCSTFAVVLPSFITMMAFVKMYARLCNNGIFKGVMAGLRPAVVGLIGAAALIMIFRFSIEDGSVSFGILHENFPDWKSWLIFAAAFAASMWTKVSPILVIVLAGIAGLILY
ncbi:MAG: chromate transporter [Bacteroidales bacterium]|nr:chromate transporter [Bacteroidales bacterium]